MTTRIDHARSRTLDPIDPSGASGAQDAGPARPATGPATSHPAPAAGSKLASSFEAGARREHVDTARQAVEGLARELPGHGVDVDAFAARFGGTQYARASKGEITGAARYQFVRAALLQSPGLADRAVAVRLRGVPATDRQIVEQALARSGTTGLSRYALAERTLASIHGFSGEERGDVLGMVKAGDSVDQAVKRERAALADIAADAKTARAGHTATRAKFDVAAQTAHWNQVLDKANAAYRQLPVLSRGAEIATGIGSSMGAGVGILVGGVHSAVTLDASDVEREVDKAGDAGGYMSGAYSSAIREAGALYMKLAAQHAEFTKLSRAVLGAGASHDYAAVPGEVERLQTLAKDMDGTSKRFFAVAAHVERADKRFDAATLDGAESVVMFGAGAAWAAREKGFAALAEELGVGEVVEFAQGEVRQGIVKSEPVDRANKALLGDDR